MTKVAVLIDGGFFLKRLRTVCPSVDRTDPAAVDRAIGDLVRSHLKHMHRRYGGATPDALLYRAFYYDAEPYRRKAHRPITKRGFDYAKSDEAVFRMALFDRLRKRAAFAVRLGEVIRERAWVLSESAQNDLLNRTRTLDELSDEDFAPGLRQKAVDMRLALDVASITLKRQAEVIVLVTGDSDFVPAAKLARREGVRVILDPLWQDVTASLFEHIDGVRSGVRKPGAKGQDEEQ
ncbi:NYN domain-containing protein [Jannaschia marina]|uniref:NYN domain-containing protein n=1 Tax=Jannaschia marina TaxID=2741674 RepID=UPI0015CC207F|nr:NYN domain-containing protein [Jannaschia marina]